MPGVQRSGRGLAPRHVSGRGLAPHHVSGSWGAQEAQLCGLSRSLAENSPSQQNSGKAELLCSKGLWWVRAVGVGLSAAVERPWAVCTPQTLLGGMLGERIHRTIDVAFPSSTVRWPLTVKIRFTGMVFPLHLNMSRAFPTHLWPLMFGIYKRPGALAFN